MELDTEGKILMAAEKVFIRDGYDGARMQEIADEAEINKAMLHYYFRTKDKLFEQILKKKLMVFFPRVKDAVESDIGTLQKFEAIVDAYLDMLSDNPQLPMFILYSLNRNMAFLQFIPAGMGKVLTRFIRTAIRNGELKKTNPEHLLASLIGMCVFPYLAKPMICHLLDKSDREYDRFLQRRKGEIMNVIKGLVVNS